MASLPAGAASRNRAASPAVAPTRAADRATPKVLAKSLASPQTTSSLIGASPPLCDRLPSPQMPARRQSPFYAAERLARRAPTTRPTCKRSR